MPTEHDKNIPGIQIDTSHATPGNGVLRPDSPEFWRELRGDLTQVGYGAISLRAFLTHYDPETNKYAATWLKGKYDPVWNSLLMSEPRPNPNGEQRVVLLDEYVASRFKPPEDDPEFTRTVIEARALMEEKLKKPYGWLRDQLYKTKTPEFWEEFSRDLTGLEGKATFRNYLSRYVPGDPESASDNLGPAHGKYRGLFANFHLPQYYEGTKEILGEAAPDDFDQLAAQERNNVLYNLAPPEVRLQLSARFPKEFGEHAAEVLGEAKILPAEAQHILDSTVLLRADHREVILDSLAKYVVAKQEGQGRLIASPAEIAKALELSANQQKKEEDVPQIPSTVEDIVRSGEDVIEVIRQAKSDNPEVAEAAKGLLESLTYAYYLPLLKREVYKPAAAYWTAFQDQHEGGMVPSATILMDYVQTQIKEKANGTHEAVAAPVKEYFDTQVLPAVYQEFARVAGRAADIEYFRRRDEKGNPKHLFLHQVEGTLELMDRNGGILADEPGTGKTVELALASLNLLDKKNIPSTRPGRVLVVGSKTVIDNWEGELEKHIEAGEADIVNINYTEEETAEGDYRLSRRIQQMRGILEMPNHSKQFALVNYDLFRHPDFQQLLREVDFDIAVVDEAHNVKSRFLESILDAGSSDPARREKVAKRTLELYSFLTGNPDRTVFLATSTPFVKDLVEPLIMAHLANPSLIPADEIKGLAKDPVATHRLLRSAMMRRTKEEIADLPPKETQFVPIDLSSMSEEERARFHELASQIYDKHEGKFARFYSMLALESQAKYPWLINKVNELTDEGKKVVIFTPFVSGEDKTTSSISTVAIASRLRRGGVSNVATFDGTTSDARRLAIQESFRGAEGTQVIVGNYLVAGESITLCSPENRATEVILFIAPNAISRYIQAVDRVHRFGQNEKVTIHIPFVTNDPLDRSEGTYDERIVGRLNRELARFGSVVDGLFFIETEDFFQSIAKGELGAVDGNINFDLDRKNEPKEKGKRNFIGRKKGGVTRKGRERFAPDMDPDDLYDPSETGASKNHDEDIEVDFTSKELADINSSLNLAEKDLVGAFLTRAQQYPLLTGEQTRFLFEHLREGSTLEALREDSRFQEYFRVEKGTKTEILFSDSKNIKDLIANCNLRLVFTASRGWYGLPLSDKIQEGSIGLFRAIEKYDHERGFAFSTYATPWIQQAVRRAIADTGSPIRLPVHMHEVVGTARQVAEAFVKEHGRNPKGDELKGLLVSQGKLTEAQVEGLMDMFRRGVTKVGSLDAAIESEKSRRFGGTSIGDLVPDQKVDVENDVAGDIQQEEKRKELELAFKGLSDNERRVLELRFGLDGGERRTLEEVGQEFGVTRERIRQIEASAISKLRRNERLKERRREEIGPRARRAEKTGLDRIPTREQPIRSPHEITEAARGNKDVWSVLSPEDRSLLSLYERGDQKVVAERLAIIFGVPPAEVARRANTALKNTEQMLGDIPLPQSYLDVKERRMAGLSNAEIAEELGKKVGWVEVIASKLIRTGEIEPRVASGPRGPKPETLELDAAVKEIMSSNPDFVNKEVAAEATSRLGREITTGMIGNSTARLIEAGELERRILSRKQLRILDFKVELLNAEGRELTYQQMADQLGYSYGQISGSVQRLLDQGKISSAEVDQKTREALEQYLNEHHNGEVNLSNFAREVGVSRQRIHQLYEQLTEAVAG